MPSHPISAAHDVPREACSARVGHVQRNSLSGSSSRTEPELRWVETWKQAGRCPGARRELGLAVAEFVASQGADVIIASSSAIRAPWKSGAEASCSH
jgi:hypothetical protein